MKLLPFAVLFLFVLIGSAQEHPLPNEPEFSEARLERWHQQFPDADADADGTLTLAEAVTYRDARSEKAAATAAKKRKRVKPTHAELRYGTFFRNSLDVYLAKSDSPTPVIIHFHGGGWLAGDKAGVNAKPFLDQGISVVSANYRFTKGSPDAAPYPAPMLDSVRVVQFVRHRAKEWNIDPQRVALTGGSAGAVISMWIAYQDDMAEADSADPVRRQSTRVSCLFPTAGPTVFDPGTILKRIGGNPDIHPAMLPFYDVRSIAGLAVPEKAKLVAESSPTSHVSKDDPPSYLIYGIALGDTPLPESATFNHSIHHPEFGVLLKEKFDAVGVECVLQSKGDGKDGKDLMAFLQKHLVGKAAP